MKYVSLSSLLTLLAACYVIHSVWTFIDIFIPPKCSRGERCLKSFLSSKPVQDLVIWTSIRQYPYSDSVQKVYTALNFDYFAPHEFDIIIQVPKETRKNGTLYMHVALLDAGKLYNDFDQIRQTETLQTIPLIEFIEPQAATFKLLNSEADKKKDHIYGYEKPYSHIRKIVPISIYADTTELPAKRLPSEMYPYIRVRRDYFLPILLHNVLKSRLSYLQLVESDMRQFNLTVEVAPASFGIVRLALHIGSALEHLKSLGFTEKDVDDVKGIFADTNLYLLSATILIATCHLLFDFLAFKNDVSFWRRKQSMVGLSSRTVLWRAFSQCVIFMYLVDEKTSLLVLVPAGISAIIELWKAKKVLRLRVRRKGWRVSVERVSGAADAGEAHTARADAEAMKYLSRLLYPLCAAGAVYSLMYEPQKSWYSWALHSIVNGVYAFGFLFMLPQLFVNYRLRSVAALPWRAFMYKAFNTFIDDVFAFVITMPTAHRVACFRDDLVFLVYLYQRWLYPVDASRIDTGVSMDEAAVVPTAKNAEDKKED